MKKMIDFEEAFRLMMEKVPSPVSVSVPISQAAHHVLARNYTAPADAPAFDQSAMDGYAFRFEDKGSSLQVVDEIPAGDTGKQVIASGTAARIFTGSRIPDGADTVVMQEHCTRDGQILTIDSPSLKAGANIRRAGSQIRKGEDALEQGTVLNAAAIGFLASMGYAEADIFKRPRIGALVTGSELIEPGKPLTDGGTYESNSVMLAAALQSVGLEVAMLRKVKDEKTDTLADIKALCEEQDVVLVTGGVSVGDYDFVHRISDDPLFEGVFHKVKQKPGKPLLFGLYNGTPIFGLPGNPASVLTGFYIYVLPFIMRMAGHKDYTLPLVRVPVLNDVSKREHLHVFLKGRLHADGVEVLPQQESYILRSYAAADCLIALPAGTEKIIAGELVNTWLLPQPA